MFVKKFTRASGLPCDTVRVLCPFHVLQQQNIVRSTDLTTAAGQQMEMLAATSSASAGAMLLKHLQRSFLLCICRKCGLDKCTVAD